jgi:membrane associated rhomboid family serine protease
MNGFPRRGRPVVTMALIALCVAVSLASDLGRSAPALMPLLVGVPGHAPFADIAHGELWRLVTPMLVHFGLLHILFNMMWLWDLGRLIELVKGSAFLLGFVVATGIASNVAQYAITGNPLFGGMSGVVYALLGYVWMQGRHNPRFGFVLHKSTVAMMLVWYVLCWTGFVGAIANWAHTAGLVLGVAWGYAQAKGRSRA